MSSKDDRIKKHYDKGHLLTVKNKFYRDFLERLFKLLLQIDVAQGDITSKRLIKDNKVVFAVIKAKEDGIIGGVEEITHILKKHKIKTKVKKKDRSKVKKGDVILELHGPIKDILKIERIILNIFQRMSGIATHTYKIVKTSKPKIAATRKTLHGYLDKKAVHLGGGLTHRLNLSDSMLIKENHLKYGGNPIKNSHIEVTSVKQALEFAKFKPAILMFDNMPPSQVKKAIKKLPKVIIFEASGIKDHKKYQFVDVISLGSLTKDSHVLDMHLKIQ